MTSNNTIIPKDKCLIINTHDGYGRKEYDHHEIKELVKTAGFDIVDVSDIFPSGRVFPPDRIQTVWLALWHD